ncbi:N-(5'-phosphoribosyl)anthranilate isomerase [Streptomyces sp. LP11]|uniref:N-(5'-phosphoribosyl)anthranilate isomerase n=1 Tax=Streptomyces pyxinicus TaxID=2970331 RepID=A0ABT2B1F3_9ACTN|nr:N-(5'-phosphoribosyl)anthranilate isomerase [Streptomyces sp. LP11]MCS0602267.1 N-(5'-phosphoribosyl)anthranilate isomerase [Streptomyces sp. LP11]
MIVKFCGATTENEIVAMAAAGADLVGLWHGVPGGRADLPAARLAALAAVALTGGRLRPMVVTFSSDTRALLAAVAASRVPCVQLHGFQPPSVVRALRRDGPPGLEIVKVLHLRAGVCLEERLTDAYERAGTDYFLMDAVTADGRLGSTAEPLADPAVTALADRIGLPFLLAGGLHAGNANEFTRARAHPRFLGIDVDSAARAADGFLRADRARAVVDAWRTV